MGLLSKLLGQDRFVRALGGLDVQVQQAREEGRRGFDVIVRVNDFPHGGRRLDSLVDLAARHLSAQGLRVIRTEAPPWGMTGRVYVEF